MSIQFWRQWLIVVTGGVIVYGLGLMLFPQVMHDLFNMLFFSSSEVIRRFGDEAATFIALVYGVLGAVMIGWMVALLSLLRRDLQRDTWNTLALSVVIWFVLDTGFSLVIGSVAHALFNTLFFVLFAIPLTAAYRHFRYNAP